MGILDWMFEQAKPDPLPSPTFEPHEWEVLGKSPFCAICGPAGRTKTLPYPYYLDGQFVTISFDRNWYCKNHYYTALAKAEREYPTWQAERQRISDQHDREWQAKVRAKEEAEKAIEEEKERKKQELVLQRENDRLARIERQEYWDAIREKELLKREDRQKFFDKLNVERIDQTMRIQQDKENDRKLDRIRRNRVDDKREGYMDINQQNKITDRDDRNKWNEQNRAHILQERAKREADLKKKIDEEMERQRLEDEKFAPKDLDL
jgi:hypothetical protein